MVSVMKIDTIMLIEFLNNKINDITKVLRSEKIVLSDDIRRKLELKNEICKEIIGEICKTYGIGNYDNNSVFEKLQKNYNRYNTKITFYDGSEIIISKHENCVYDNGFIILPKNNLLYGEGFNTEYVMKVETLR